MSAFRFTLEPVLRQRLHAEHEAQKVVAKCERERLAIEAELSALQMLGKTERAELVNRLATHGRINAGELRQQSAAAGQLLRRMREASLRLSGAHHRLEQARPILMKATAARRAIELVRDQQLAEFRAAEQRRETEALDEISMALRRLEPLGSAASYGHMDGDAE